MKADLLLDIEFLDGAVEVHLSSPTGMAMDLVTIQPTRHWKRKIPTQGKLWV